MNTILWSRCTTSPQMNKGIIYNTSYSNLNMKRKALTLQHHNNSFKITNAQLYSKIVRNTYPNNHQQNILPYNTNINIDISTCTLDPSAIVTSSLASQSDVPGDKSFIINYNYKTPIYNYIPVRRKQSNSTSKYPYTAWTSGRLGFGVGKKGSNAKMRKLANDNLEQNKVEFSSTTINRCNNRNCEYQNIKFIVNKNSILGQLSFFFDNPNHNFSIWDLAIIQNNLKNNVPLRLLELDFQFIEIEKNDILYNEGMVWYIPFSQNKQGIIRIIKDSEEPKATFFLVLTWINSKNQWNLYLTNSFISDTRFIQPTNYMYPLLNICPPPLIQLSFDKTYRFYDSNYRINPLYISNKLYKIVILQQNINASQSYIIKNKTLPFIVSNKVLYLDNLDKSGNSYWWNSKYKWTQNFNKVFSSYGIILTEQFLKLQNDTGSFLFFSEFNNIICN